ncbi:MAG: hypothetical protein RR428_07375 [Coprobacillus sp.]
MNGLTKNIISVVCFIVSMALVFIGQRNVGYTGLAMEIIGLIGLLALLYSYNKKYK